MKRCPDCLRPVATKAQWSGMDAHPGECECETCSGTCWGCDAEAAAQARGRAKRADLERRTVELLGDLTDPDGSYGPEIPESFQGRARALLAEWKEVSRG